MHYDLSLSQSRNKVIVEFTVNLRKKKNIFLNFKILFFTLSSTFQIFDEILNWSKYVHFFSNILFANEPFCTVFKLLRRDARAHIKNQGVPEWGGGGGSGGSVLCQKGGEGAKMDKIAARGGPKFMLLTYSVSFSMNTCINACYNHPTPSTLHVSNQLGSRDYSIFFLAFT